MLNYMYDNELDRIPYFYCLWSFVLGLRLTFHSIVCCHGFSILILLVYLLNLIFLFFNLSFCLLLT
ncbi:hypothetical protein J3F84DRAFT_198893 [Trichoderma pleuroticola]